MVGPPFRFPVRVKWIIPTGIRILQRIPPGIRVPIVVDDHPRVRHHRVRRQERAQLWVIVAGVEVEQAGGVLLLAGEGAVRLQRSTAAADCPVGVVRAAGYVVVVASSSNPTVINTKIKITMPIMRYTRIRWVYFSGV